MTLTDLEPETAPNTDRISRIGLASSSSPDRADTYIELLEQTEHLAKSAIVASTLAKRFANARQKQITYEQKANHLALRAIEKADATCTLSKSLSVAEHWNAIFQAAAIRRQVQRCLGDKKRQTKELRKAIHFLEEARTLAKRLTHDFMASTCAERAFCFRALEKDAYAAEAAKEAVSYGINALERFEKTEANEESAKKWWNWLLEIAQTFDLHTPITDYWK